MLRLILGYTITTLGAAYGVFLVTSLGWAFIILGFLACVCFKGGFNS